MGSNGPYYPTVTPERVKEIMEEHESRKKEQAAYGKWLGLHAERKWRERQNP